MRCGGDLCVSVYECDVMGSEKIWNINNMVKSHDLKAHKSCHECLPKLGSMLYVKIHFLTLEIVHSVFLPTFSHQVLWKSEHRDDFCSEMTSARRHWATNSCMAQTHPLSTIRGWLLGYFQLLITFVFTCCLDRFSHIWLDYRNIMISSIFWAPVCWAPPHITVTTPAHVQHMTEEVNRGL